MGKFTNNTIARISKSPHSVSLTSSPNFIEIEKLNAQSNTQQALTDISLTILKAQGDADASSFTISVVDEISKASFDFKSTTDVKAVNATTFFYHLTGKHITAENIRKCLLRNTFVKSNFNVTVPVDNGSNGHVVRIVSKPNVKGVKLKIDWASGEKHFSIYSKSVEEQEDTIKQGMLSPADTQIEMEIYTHTGISLGVDDFTRWGTPTVSMVKSYSGIPLWFDINSIWHNQHSYSNACLTAQGWCDAGTATDYRFVLKRADGVINEMFYMSDVHYVLSGYARSLDENNLHRYVHNAKHKNKIEPLSTRTSFTHVRGQSQYFNFILSNPLKYTSYNAHICLEYHLLDQRRKLVKEGRQRRHWHHNRKMFVVNTVKLDLDDILDNHPERENVAWVEVSLLHTNEIVSMPLRFEILPDWWHPVHDFTFLNSLGGWSSFNFGGRFKSEFKTSTESLFKTQTPYHTSSSEIESVFTKQVEEQFVVETTPLKADVANWLKEMSASPAVYELNTGRYVIVDSLDVNIDSKRNLFTLQMKYHYSDSYNGNIKA